MILDSLQNKARYASLHPFLAAAMNFIDKTNLHAMPVGKHEIQGTDIYAIAMMEQGRSKPDCKLEAHRLYADIQILLDGTEEMGWKPTAACAHPTADYNPDKDIVFFNDPPDSWFTLAPAQFALFFQEDAHLPLVSTGRIHKIVIKVRFPTNPAAT